MPSRVAIVFDNSLRPETTGFYCRRALGQLVDAEHVLPIELGRIETGRFDLFIYVDDGLPYLPSNRLGPNAFWAIDTHLSFDRCLAKARQCDFVFAAQKDGADQFCREGISATWLPLACDAQLHRSHDVPKQFDWCFVGHLFPGSRSALIDTLRTEFPDGFVGQRYFEQMAITYSQSKLVFNRSILNDLNMRVFEALACGSMLVTNDLKDNAQSETFQDAVHMATYGSPEELIDKFRYYLRHDAERQRIATAGQAEVLSKHTYRHRMQTILAAASRRTVSAFVPEKFDVPEKDIAYFEWDRPDVLALVPTTARRVVDLGCGAGRLGRSIKARQHAEVWGVERDPAAARRAATRLDHVIIGNLDEQSWSIPSQSMDVIICADVLEHLRDPARLLKRCRDWLASDGTLIASLPNVQHHSVLSALLEGNFTYEPAGLLDEDHLRLFTRREIEKLFYRAGYRIVDWRVVPGSGHADWVDEGRPAEIRVGGLIVRGIEVDHCEAFFAYQYLVRAVPVPIPDYGLTSIILVTHNQLNFTHRCLESLRFRTDEPYELIVVDNASTDGSVDYLRAQPDIKLITNDKNRGFPAAVNQGLKESSGRQVLLLNNDTIPTSGWLGRMLSALDSDQSIGIVGPVSNSVSGPQQVDVGYRDLASLDGFAWERGRRFDGQRVDHDRIVGFCMLIRRQVINAIGLLDERFGIGNFEDDDYCRRTRNAGFRTVIALDSFVHHFGSRTFAASGIDTAQLLRENEQKYRAKWNDPSPSDTDQITKTFSMRQAAGGGLLLVPVRLRLALCMIVRNNEGTIRACLESIRPWVDEMIVVDTGSTDATPQIAAELGARVHHWPWRDDFSAARNESVSLASSEWVFWMDSDDTIPPECGQRLRELVDRRHPEKTLGYVMQVHCPGPSGDPHDVTVVDHLKLFQNRSDLRFEHRIHEQILPAIRRAGGEVEFTDIYVIHSGADHSATGRQRKLERDFRLLKLDLDERPDHPFVLFNLGMTHADCGEYEQAIHWLSRCLEVSPSDQSHVRKTYALLVSSLVQHGEIERALSLCQDGRALFPDDKELLFRHAMLAHEFRQYDQAVSLYLEVIKPQSERHFVSIDAGLSGFKARHNLALVYEDQERFDLAEQQWWRILEEQADYLPARLSLIECLLRRGCREGAVVQIEHLQSQPSTSAEGCRMAARLAEVDRQIDKAIQILKQGIDGSENCAPLVRELARLLYETEDYGQAVQYLQSLVGLTPSDPSAWHNLGIVLNHLSRQQESQHAMERSASMRRSRIPSRRPV